MSERRLQQYGPWPTDLETLVKQLRYRPGWLFSLRDMVRDPADTHGVEAGGLTLDILTMGYNSYRPEDGRSYRVHHYFPVPAATFNAQSWQRWLLDCLLKVETHECMEFFALGTDGETNPNHPYAATHAPGDDPYVIHEYAAELQRQTSFRGVVNA